MQINQHTPQDALERLFRAVTRRELLSGTPLNVRLLLRYALLFILFPGMVCGFWVGLGLTLVFCVALLLLLAASQGGYAALAVQAWLLCGGLVFVWVCLGATLSAVRRRRLRETPLPPASAASPAASAPLAQSGAKRALRWHKSESGDEWLAELSWQAPTAGIYAALLSVQGMGRRRLLTLGRQGVCTVYTATSPQGDLQALLLYKLEPGQHTLRWALLPRAGAPPHAELTLLRCPE